MTIRARRATMANVRVVVLVFAAVGPGCGRVDFAPAAPDATLTGPADAGMTGPADATAAGCGPWGAPVHLATTSSVFTEWSPALDPSGLVLVFSSNRAQAGYDHWAATRATVTSPFDPPVAMPALSSNGDDSGATFSGDGSTLYYYSMSSLRRADHLGAGTFASVSPVSGFPGFDFALSPDDLELFTSKGVGQDDLDVGHATRTNPMAAWVEDSDTAALNQVGTVEGWPVFDARTQTVYFERDGTDGSSDLARATRPGPGQAFAPPEAIAEVNDAGIWYADPTLSGDGTIMIFAADYPSGLGAHDLYQVTRSCR